VVFLGVSVCLFFCYKGVCSVGLLNSGGFRDRGGFLRRKVRRGLEGFGAGGGSRVRWMVLVGGTQAGGMVGGGLSASFGFLRNGGGRACRGDGC